MINSDLTLSSLAILKVDLDEGVRDYLGYFENFIISLLRRHKPDPVTDSEVAKLFEEDYGLRIPDRAAQIVLRRLAKQKLLARSHETYRIVGELPQVDFSAKRSAATESIERVYESLRAFAKQSFNLDWDNQEIHDGLLAFLNRFAVDCIRAYVFRTALPTAPKDGGKSLYIVSRFITDAYHDKDPVFESIIVLVKGLMYANALTCPDLEGIEKKFNQVTFFLDTPLVLDVLDVNADEHADATQELVTLVRNLKGTVALFDHTLDEVDRVLEFGENNIDNPNADGKIVRVFRGRGYKRGDIALIRGRLSESARESGLKVISTPRYKKHLQIDEQALQAELEKNVRYTGKEGSTFDVNSVRSIYVLRDGYVPKRLEDAKAVLVTTNPAFAQTAFEHGKDHNSTREVSPVITDYSLANVAWLKAPMGAPTLPEKETLAACYAAMEPRKSLWAKYMAEVDSLKAAGKISPDDHAMLRVSGIAVDELMNMTQGDESALTGGTVANILERVRKSYQAESVEALKVEEEEHARTRVEKEVVEKKNEIVSGRLYWISERISIAVLYGLTFLGVTILVISSLASLSFTTPWIAQSETISAIANGSIFLGVVWAVYSGYSGASVKSASHRMRGAIQGRVFAKMKRWMLGE